VEAASPFPSENRQALSPWRRLLALAAAGDDPFGKLRAFELILLIHVSTRIWIWALRPYAAAGNAKLLAAVAVTALSLAALKRAWARPAVAVIALILFVKLIATFPAASNHSLLELLAIVLLASFDRRLAEERTLLLEALCWGVIIVFFSSGLQKVLYGTYFDAQFLGSFIALKSSFAQAFGLLVPAAEVSRLQSLPIREGAGPFAIDVPAIIVLSNAVYALEMVVPVFLLMGRTRTVAAAVAIVFTAALQTAARELLFGALFINLLLLFPRRAVNWQVLPLFVLLYACLLATRLLAPEVYFN
jgi:hypothetical protein